MCNSRSHLPFQSSYLPALHPNINKIVRAFGGDLQYWEWVVGVGVLKLGIGGIKLKTVSSNGPCWPAVVSEQRLGAADPEVYTCN